MFEAFSIARLPRIRFGAGLLADVPGIAAGYGTRALLVTGARSFRDSPAFETLRKGFHTLDVGFEVFAVPSEPSPERVDEAVAAFKGDAIDVVVGIGGGSALDAAKAIAGLLRPGNSVMDHLEGVGPEHPYRGPAVPFVAVPTTAGTGSEATKNAVLSRQGADGFKKSFRDDKLVAEWALVDPELIKTCPPGVIAANGMDAFTQLLESYVSTKTNPMTEALARSGMEAFADGFWAAHAGGETDAAKQGRARTAYASLLSGICLAQTGLGSVHGLASPLGAFFPIPHGVVCGALLADATAVNIRALKERDPAGLALNKYAAVGRLLATDPDDDPFEALTATLRDWTEKLALPRLGAYGVTAADVDRIVAASRGSSMKTNPLVLTDAEIAEVVAARL